MTTQLAAAARVRRFNRFYTRRIGLLDAGHLHTPFSLAEARVLYEVAHLDRPTASTLIATLDLDAGYLSRLLRGLRQRGLLTARAASGDRRRRELALTASGRKAFGQLDARATDAIAGMLERLSAPERDRLLASLGTVEALLGRCRAGARAHGAVGGAARTRAGRSGMGGATSRRAVRRGVRLGCRASSGWWRRSWGSSRRLTAGPRIGAGSPRSMASGRAACS